MEYPHPRSYGVEGVSPVLEIGPVEAVLQSSLRSEQSPEFALNSSRFEEDHFGDTDVIRFTNEEATPPNPLEDLRHLNDQRNFDAFRARHVENLRSQLAGIDKVIKDERKEAENIQKEEEQNADWMWDVQRNYAELEKQMAELDSQRLQLKEKQLSLTDDYKIAQQKLEKEEAYVQKLHLNEQRNQTEIQKLNEYYHKYYEEKEQAYVDAKIVDTGIERQKKELKFTKLKKRHLDFEIYRMQRQITAAEERMALREVIKQQNEEQLQKLKSQKLELIGEIEVLHQQDRQISLSLTVDMRFLEDKNETSTKLNIELGNAIDLFKSVSTETNGFRKEIRHEQMRNEQLTHSNMRTARDLAGYEKKIGQHQLEIEQLYDQYGKMSRLAQALTERADALNRYQSQKQFDLQIVRDHLSKEIQKKQNADATFHEALMENKAFLKAARFSMLEYEKLGEKLHQIEEDVGQQEYEIAQQSIARIETSNAILSRTEELEQLAQDVRIKEEQLKEAQIALDKESAAIDRRQDKINRLMGKLDILIAAAGGEEISPIEAEISALQIAIQDGEEQFRKLNQDWLRYQTSIVKLTETRDQLHAKATDLDNQAFIATYKLNRLNKEIAQTEKECAEYAKTDKLIRENIARASDQLYKFNEKEKELVMKALDMEHSSVAALRDAEIHLQEDQENLDKSIEALKNTEEEIYATKESTLMWERRLELKKYAKNAIDQDFNKEELERLRNEVHKLEIDKQSLEKEQVRVTQEMLFAAERRDQLHTLARRRVMEGEGPSLKKVQQMTDRKTRDLQALQKELKAVQIAEVDCRKRVDIFQKTVEHKTVTVNAVEESWKKVVEQKTDALKQRFQVRLDNFIAQQYGKHYLAVKDGKLSSKRLRSKDVGEMESQVNVMKQKFEDLRKIVMTIGERNFAIYEDRKNQQASVRQQSSRSFS